VDAGDDGLGLVARLGPDPLVELDEADAEKAAFFGWR